MSSARETPKPSGEESETEQANEQESPGGSGQDDPGEEPDVRTYTDDTESQNSTEQSTEPSPSCGWKGVAAAMGVKPGR
jgi:hypothetical protein